MHLFDKQIGSLVWSMILENFPEKKKRDVTTETSMCNRRVYNVLGGKARPTLDELKILSEYLNADQKKLLKAKMAVSAGNAESKRRRRMFLSGTIDGSLTKVSNGIYKTELTTGYGEAITVHIEFESEKEARKCISFIDI